MSKRPGIPDRLRPFTRPTSQGDQGDQADMSGDQGDQGEQADMSGDQGDQGEQADMSGYQMEAPASGDESEPVIRVRILEYVVLHYSQDPVEPVRVILHTDSPYVATVHFYKPEANLRSNMKSRNSIGIYYYIYDLRIFLDLLRNEKPVFLVYNPNYRNAYISTSREPVGEEEAPNAGEGS